MQTNRAKGKGRGGGVLPIQRRLRIWAASYLNFVAFLFRIRSVVSSAPSGKDYRTIKFHYLGLTFWMITTSPWHCIGGRFFQEHPSPRVLPTHYTIGSQYFWPRIIAVSFLRTAYLFWGYLFCFIEISWGCLTSLTLFFSFFLFLFWGQ
jgi:hypothetical protein